MLRGRGDAANPPAECNREKAPKVPLTTVFAVPIFVVAAYMLWKGAGSFV
jgi:hypothetical protein